MEDRKDISILFYQHLAKLFYAIAYADKKLNKVEVEIMKKEISLWSMNYENIETHEEINMKHHITSTFEMLSIEEKHAQKCFDDFIMFKQNHESLFTKSTKNAILKIAGKIASSFSNLNKSELIMLAKLSIEFKEKTEE